MATGAGALFMAFIKRNNPWFMGPLVVSMGVTLAGIQWTAIPSEMSNMAQLFIGISLGVRFKREFIRTAPQWLLSVALGTLGMMLANVPVVYLGERMTRLVPMRVVHIVSALVFAVLGVLALMPI
jgi:uncharacterized membrane protein AbrB (regulator of aidB expression)